MLMRRLLLVLSWLLIAPVAGATQVLSLSLDAMEARSDVVVWGTVVDVRSEAIPGDTGRFHTLVTVKVKERLKGATATSEVVFSVPGGRVGRFAQRVPGAPTFALGQELVVLLQKHHRGRLMIVGFAQGSYLVERHPGQPARAISDRRGLALISRTPAGRLTLAPAGSEVDDRRLDTLLTRIRSAVAATPEQGTVTP